MCLLQKVLKTHIWTGPCSSVPLAVQTQIQDEGFSLKFGPYICELVLYLHMKHWTEPWQTGSFWTRPCRAKPRPASPNHLRSALLWDIPQHRVVTPYRHLASASGVKKSKRKNTAWWKLTDTFFFPPPLFFGGGTLHTSNFLTKFPLSDKAAPNLLDPLYQATLSQWAPHRQ
jgi:hypothetical protein